MEKQSQTDAFDFRVELAEVKFHPKSKILDAGCGSGIVSRYLANEYPDAHVTGCDFSNERVHLARNEIGSLLNLDFCQQDLTRINFESNQFDAIVCRFVLEHLTQTEVHQALQELYRCLKPGGKICMIDRDGCPANIYPRTPLMETFFRAFETKSLPDMRIGRKLPSYLIQNGFTTLDWKVHTTNFVGANLLTETDLIESRFQNTFAMVEEYLGDSSMARQFISEYMDMLKQKGTTLFYNKFIVVAEKPAGLRLL